VSVAEPRQALLLDLDGTLYRGDGPVLAYAGAVADTLAEADAADYLFTVDKYLAGGIAAVTEPALRTATDGWEAVAALASARHGVGRAVLDRAFLASRRALATDDCAVEVPDGLLAALRTLRSSTHLVLATNSPETGLAPLLARLGAGDLFDRVVSGANKPVGTPGLLTGLADRVGAAGQPWRLASVGDHWRNDIAPAREFGAVTGYIDRFGRADGPADVVAASMDGVLPTILRWAADPVAFHRSRPVTERT
jgi:FMN phosphatase YigB (HAD superfamily)